MRTRRFRPDRSARAVIARIDRVDDFLIDRVLQPVHDRIADRIGFGLGRYRLSRMLLIVYMGFLVMPYRWVGSVQAIDMLTGTIFLLGVAGASFLYQDRDGPRPRAATPYCRRDTAPLRRMLLLTSPIWVIGPLAINADRVFGVSYSLWLTLSLISTTAGIAALWILSCRSPMVEVRNSSVSSTTGIGTSSGARP